MTPLLWLRTILFNLIYYGSVPIIGLCLAPALLLPDRWYWPVVRGYFTYVYLLGKYILGLDYRLTGLENLPQDTPYIIAAKHQSAYETLLLPVIFPRPAVILKQELLRIPIWGWYAAKAGMIGIDRSNPRTAMPRMIERARAALSHGHTLVIFPQGTRVAPHETPAEKPYKRGIAELYAALNMPIVPMALNAGLFWPRNAFFKCGGTVDIAFLPPIPPGKSKEELMQSLQTRLETASAALAQSAASPLLPTTTKKEGTAPCAKSP